MVYIQSVQKFEGNNFRDKIWSLIRIENSNIKKIKITIFLNYYRLKKEDFS